MSSVTIKPDRDQYHETYRDWENPSRLQNLECTRDDGRYHDRASMVYVRHSHRGPDSPCCSLHGRGPVQIGHRGRDMADQFRGHGHELIRRRNESQSAERFWF